MLFGRHINKYYLKYWLPYTVGILFLIFVDYIQTIIPEQIGEIVESLKEANLTKNQLGKLVLTILFIGILIGIGRFIWRMTIIGSCRKIETNLKNEMYEHSQSLSQNYHSKQKIGALMSLYTADVESVRQSLGFGVVMFIDATFLTIITLYKMFALNVILTLFAIIPMLVIGIGGLWFSASLTKIYKIKQEAQENLSDFIQENFTGISVIRAFVKQRQEIREFTKHNNVVYNTSMKFIRKIALLEMLIESLISMSVILIFGIGGYLASRGSISAGDLTKFYLFFVLLIWPMIALAQVINNLSQGRASLKRISKFLDEKIEVKDGPNLLDVKEIEGKIEFKNLTFKYETAEVNALENVSFTINVGEMVGIIGRTGCGKSTLVELLLRTYNLDEESLFIDNNDIMKMPIKVVRHHIGYVPQNNFLFSDTIHNNISFGLLEDLDNRELVTKMAKLADIDKNIQEFPDNYDTIVGERGTTLSGGQKQRISIARALIKDPSILIFDDSVSAVDTATETKILANLRRVRKNKTTIIIGHRISTMQSLDKIILLDEGKIVAVGNHNQLIDSCELYQNMVKAQELLEG